MAAQGTRLTDADQPCWFAHGGYDAIEPYDCGGSYVTMPMSAGDCVTYLR